jgi:hypothetical protein
MAKQTYTTGQVLTAAQMTTLQANDYNWTVSAKTANYVLVAADAGTRITMSNASSTTITVNTGVFTAGDTLEIINLGAGVCTITAGTATVSTSAVLALKQYDSGTLFFSATGTAIFFSSDAADNTSPLTTKGDLYTYSTTDARLAVGANDSMLVGDSTAATGLSYKSAATLFAWTTWTPTVSNLSIGNGTAIYRYAQIGKTVFIDIAITLGSTSTVSGSPFVTLPVNAAYGTFAAAANYEDNGVQFWLGIGYVASTGVSFKATNTTGTYAFSAECSSTIPFTWGTSDKINCQFSYESV